MKKIRNWIRILFALSYRNNNLQNPNQTYFKFYSNAEQLLSTNKYPVDFKQYLHRTILWDQQEPLATLPSIRSVVKYSKGYQHIMWNGKTTDTLISSHYENASVYFNYPKKIMKADFARYFILYQYGGIYLDLDITMYSPVHSLILRAYSHTESSSIKKDEFCILFEEYRWTSEKEAVNEQKQPIRNSLETTYHTEALIRIANYAMIATPKHPFVKKIIQVCEERAHLTPKNDYDILFITGPDVVSHVYETCDKDFLEKYNVILISKEEHDQYIRHHGDGHWRKNTT